MKLWLISQSVNNGYDTYDSAVVAAIDEDAARHTYPREYYVWHEDSWAFQHYDGTLSKSSYYSDWAMPKDVQVQYLGTTDRPPGLVLASFNAG